ncbi:hypothetical protein KIN20_021998 [Parelaphostrongylus tenuis]|uniref:Uncharacterized protein n=1 Tax=Parelaphostrongylus tenuis TaxID=148309 RepID=A0AAD5QUX0_PARTN|nr:hypothetical protein KIN20_021998 [Parelaphostrongylus tenuis]
MLLQGRCDVNDSEDEYHDKDERLRIYFLDVIIKAHGSERYKVFARNTMFMGP